MKKNLALLILIILLLISFNTNAQHLFGNTKDLKEFRERPLVVILNESAGNKHKKFYNKEQEIAFRLVNEFMVNSMSNYWKVRSKIIFIKPEEIEKYTTNKKNPKKYAILQLQELFKYDKDHPKVTIYTENYIRLSLSERPDKPIYQYNILEDIITPAVVAKSLMHIQHFVNKSVQRGKEFKYDEGLNSNELKNLTLLIDEKRMYEKLTKDDIQKSYGYRFEITTAERIEEIILNKTPGYAFIIIQSTSSSNSRANQYVMRAESGQIIAASISGYIARTMSRHFFIEKYNLKEYVKSKAI